MQLRCNLARATDQQKKSTRKREPSQFDSDDKYWINWIIEQNQSFLKYLISTLNVMEKFVDKTNKYFELLCNDCFTLLTLYL